MGFPYGSAGKESACNARDLGSIPGLGRSPGEGKGCPLQYSGLENSMAYIDLGVAKSRIRLSGFHFHFEYLMGRVYEVVFPGSSADKESICNVGDLGLIPGLGRSSGEGKGCPLQYPDLEGPMDCIAHGVTKSQHE